MGGTRVGPTARPSSVWLRAFDTLDGSDAFVHPDAMAAVAASDKRAERAALDEIVDIVADAVRRWEAGDAGDQALFGRIVEAWHPSRATSGFAASRSTSR